MASRRTLDQPANLKGDTDEEDHARRRPDRRLSCARHGRRLPECLPDAALKSVCGKQ
jgi:hypothetical protein